MAIVKKEDGFYHLDIRVNKRRIREKFHTKDDAKNYERELKATAKLTDSGLVISRAVKLSDALKNYYELVSINKNSDTHKYEEVMLDALFERLTFAGIWYVHEIKLVHLLEVQSFLKSTPIHTKCRMRLRKIAVSRGESLGPMKITEPVKECKTKCSAQVLSASSVNRWFNTYLDVFSFFEKNEYCVKNYAKHVERLEEKPKTKKPADSATVQLVMDFADRNGQKLVADCLFIMNSIGARPVELRNLNHGDFDAESSTVVLRSKKTKTRTVYVDETIRQFLLSTFDHTKRPTDPIFVSPLSKKRLDTSALARAVSRICEQLEIKDFTPYCIRHGVVTELRRMGVDRSTIGELVGNTERINKVYDHMEAKEHAPNVIALAERRKVLRKEMGKSGQVDCNQNVRN